MGYKRNAKKCKEKFENVHKYYKRTKERELLDLIVKTNNEKLQKIKNKKESILFISLLGFSIFLPLKIARKRKEKKK
jgi:hypothetical protein